MLGLDDPIDDPVAVADIVANTLRDAKHDLLAFSAFPTAHWRQIWSTNPLERVHREIKRCTDVVGVFPNDAAINRLVTAVIVEQHDKWQGSERRYLAEGSMAALMQPPDEPPAAERSRRRLAS